ncbi:MAG: hypothetical protein HYS08_01765 [Chlamydiae bacterium]|nr:hypothetical protein [Chlamydiota bacterium]
MISKETWNSIDDLVDSKKWIEQMDWSVFYDAASKTLKGGYSLKKNEDLQFQYGDLGTDARTAFFLAIATGGAPLDLWNSAKQVVEERYGIQYLGPGWKGGGLFLQGMTGLFLDERGTLMGKSMANMTYAQINHGWKKNYPVWGWSCCAAPDGSYLGVDKIVDSVVSPYASILSVIYYPKQVVENLKALEKFKIRTPFETDKGMRSFGFRDSVNIETGKMT